MSNIEDAKKFIYSRNGNYFGTFMVDDTEFIRYTCEKGHQNSATLYVCYFRDWCQQCSIDRNKSAKQKIKGLLKMKEKRRETISYQLYKVHTPITPETPPETKKSKKKKKLSVPEEVIPPPPIFISPPPPILPYNPSVPTPPVTKDSIPPPISLDELRQKRENLASSGINKRPSMFRRLTGPKRNPEEMPPGLREKLAAAMRNESELADI